MNYIFDLDDTLVKNSDIPYHAITQLLKELPHRTTEEDLSTKKFYDRMKERYRHHHLMKTREYMEKGLIQLAPGVEKFLDETDSFTAGLTNAPHSSTSYKLEELGLDGFLDPVLTPKDVKKKPSPEGIQKIIQSSGLPKESFVFVGDSLKDLIAGKRAGVRTVLITSEWKRFFADESYSSFQQFLKHH